MKNRSRLPALKRLTLPVLSLGCIILINACSSHTAPSTSAPLGGTPLPPGAKLPLGQTLATPNVPVRYTSVGFDTLPGWKNQNLAPSLTSFKRGCTVLQRQTPWRTVCLQAAQTPDTAAAARQFFEQYFTAWQITDTGKDTGTVTGYYEPAFKGDTRPTASARFPIYGVPADMVTLELPGGQRSGRVRVDKVGSNRARISPSGVYSADLSAFAANPKSRVVKGRFEGNRFVPYYTRAQINAGALNGKAPILGYANDPVELFFVHIQGSGRMITPDGRSVHLSFADKNEYPFKSIAQYMANRGYLPLGQTSMQGIRAWMAQHPQHLAEILGQNPSYIFFRANTSAGREDGPTGSLGVPLMGGYAAAVDKHHIALGSPLYLVSQFPDGAPLERLLMAQDTGSAITGGVRVDYFAGFGDEAGAVAGRMKSPGRVWTLMPNNYAPRYQP